MHFLSAVCVSLILLSTFSEALRHNPAATAAALRKSVVFNSGRLGTCEQHPVPVPLTATALDQLQPVLQQVDAAIKQAFVASGVPGISVGIVYNQTLIWSQGYGAINLNGSAPQPDKDTLYRIGSVSKVFADMAMLQIRDKGLIQLDDRVADFVDFKMVNPWPLEEGITFRQLASHLAGTPRSSPCNAIIGDCDLSTAEIFERFAAEPYIQPPSVQPSYSNAGFALLGHTLESVVGVSYAGYVVDSILTPLGMNSTGFDYTDDVMARLATGYISSMPNAPAPAYDLGWEAPAGQMYSSVADLAKLASFLFTVDVVPYDTLDAPTPTQDVVNRTSVRESLLPAWITEDATFGFGMPWELYHGSGFWMATKGGDVLGYTASFFTIPSSKLAFITLANSDAYSPSQFNVAAIDALYPTFETILQKLQPPPALPAYAQSLVGIYSGSMGQFNATANVTLNAQTQIMHLVLALDTPFGAFPWVDMDLAYDAERDTFMTTATAAEPCQGQQINGNLQYVDFVRSPTQTVSVPGLLWSVLTYVGPQ